MPRFLLSRTSFCADDRTAFQHAARPGAGCRVDCESSSGRQKRPFCHMWANTNQIFMRQRQSEKSFTERTSSSRPRVSSSRRRVWSALFLASTLALRSSARCTCFCAEHTNTSQGSRRQSCQIGITGSTVKLGGQHATKLRAGGQIKQSLHPAFYQAQKHPTDTVSHLLSSAISTLAPTMSVNALRNTQ